MSANIVVFVCVGIVLLLLLAIFVENVLPVLRVKTARRLRDPYLRTISEDGKYMIDLVRVGRKWTYIWTKGNTK